MNKIHAQVIARKIYEKECLKCKRFYEYCTPFSKFGVYNKKEFSEGEIKQKACVLGPNYKGD